MFKPIKPYITLKTLQHLSKTFFCYDMYFQRYSRWQQLLPYPVYIIKTHHTYNFQGIATVFVLCEGRSTSLYKAMWEKIVSLAPGLKKNLKFIMADYEKAAISAMSEQFPTVTIHGCWFHYSQVF